MGTDCAPANLTLFTSEFTYMHKLGKKNEIKKCDKLFYTFRYIDDITIINDMDEFEKIYKDIYPESLNLKKVNSTNQKCDVLDIAVEINNNKFITELFDKRRTFKFHCNVFPHSRSNIPRRCLYNVFTNELRRLSCIISDQHSLQTEINKLIRMLTEKEYNKQKLTKYFLKFQNHNQQQEKIKRLYCPTL